MKEAFNGNEPIHEGGELDGFCGLCNDRKAVQLRQWFICPMCFNVARAYQKSWAASSFVWAFWAESVQTRVPSLNLVETEPVCLEPYVASRRSRATKNEAGAAGRAPLDFAVREAGMPGENTLFHIEMKAGPSEPGGMKAFQLDENDYDDIVSVVRHTRRPSYVFHVQIVANYLPPTSQTVACGLWWTDVFALRKAFVKRISRRGETKVALEFDRNVFQPAASFPEAIERRDHERLQREVEDLQQLVLPPVSAKRA